MDRIQKITTAQIEDTHCRALVRAALEAREHAYAPYSHFHVGAALLGESGRIYTGCNIENCGYSATVCAERTAIFKAVSEGERRFAAIAVVGAPAQEQAPLSGYAAPCGICRQVMAEFCGMDFLVLIGRSADDFRRYTLGELLPAAFTPASL